MSSLTSFYDDAVSLGGTIDILVNSRLIAAAPKSPEILTQHVIRQAPLKFSSWAPVLTENHVARCTVPKY